MTHNAQEPAGTLDERERTLKTRTSRSQSPIGNALVFESLIRKTLPQRGAPSLRHPDLLRENPIICGIGVNPKVTQASSLCPCFLKRYFPYPAAYLPTTRDLFSTFVIVATRLTGWKPVSPSSGSRPFLTGSRYLNLRSPKRCSEQIDDLPPIHALRIGDSQTLAFPIRDWERARKLDARASKLLRPLQS